MMGHKQWNEWPPWEHMCKIEVGHMNKGKERTTLEREKGRGAGEVSGSLGFTDGVCIINPAT